MGPKPTVLPLDDPGSVPAPRVRNVHPRRTGNIAPQVRATNREAPRLTRRTYCQSAAARQELATKGSEAISRGAAPCAYRR